MFMNKVVICGVVCNTPELRHTKNEVPVTNFTVRTVESWKNKMTDEFKSDVKFHKIVCWGNVAKRAVRILQKGDISLVEGGLSYHKHIESYENGATREIVNTEIKATNVQTYNGNKFTAEDSTDPSGE